MNRLVVRLALILLALSLGPLAGLGFVIVGLIERSITEQVRTTHRNLAGVARGSLRLYMETASGKLKTVAAMLQEQGGKSEAKVTAARLNSLLEPPDIFVEMSVYRIGDSLEQVVQAKQVLRSAQQQEYGGQQSRLEPYQTIENLSNRPWSNTLTNDHPLVKLARSGNQVYAPNFQMSDDLNVLAMAVPLGDRSDTILTASLDLAPVWKQLVTIGGEREIQLVDSVGNILLNTRAEGVLTGDVLEASVPVGHADWSIVVREPRSSAFEPLRHARLQAIAWIGGAGVLAVGLSFSMAAFVLRPVRALTQAADRLRAGDLSARTGVARDDELGRLAASFDRMAAALQELDQAKSDFVAHASHELRTPLTSIKLSVANLLDGVVGPVDAKQQEVLERARVDLDRLIRMVNELLDIARLEAGKVALQKERLDLAAVAKTAVDTLRPLAERKGVSVNVASEPAPLEGDRAKLHEIVINLVDNAVKFTPSGGRVDVTVSPGRLVVRDTGCGIPAGRLPRIFDKFAQVDTHQPGAGLGLSITRKLVELHGGSISAESAEGRGSTFTVTL